MEAGHSPSSVRVGAESTERAALARELNVAIRSASERFPAEKEVTLEFYCEWDCWQTVNLTAADYDALKGEPIYLAGHQDARNRKPPTG